MMTRTRILLAACTAAVLLIGCGDQEAGDDEMADDQMATEEMANDQMDEDPMAQGGMQADTLTADLTGGAEVPGPGDPDGSGSATVALNPEQGQVCYEITVEGIADPAAAHIHTGAEGESGPPLVDFNIGENGLAACVDAEAETIEDIAAAPSQYYVNVHNSEYGGGAVRGQLQ